MDESSLIESILTIVDSHFKEDGQPILLSKLQPIVINKMSKEKYEKLLNGRTLKQFLQATSSNESGYRVVIHPNQAAKIGVVPFDSEFSYDENHSHTEKSAPQKSSDRVQALLKILSSLSDQDLEKIDIPVTVFVKLYKNNGK